MAKKQYFIIIDTETTQDGLVADFAAVVTDRKGKIHAQCAVLVADIYNSPKHPLFFDSNAPADAIWSKAGQDRRYQRYNNMIANGSRMLASVAGINVWLAKAQGKYNPTMTAYNLAFDVDKMRNTGIDHTLFNDSFCLWYAAAGKWGQSRKFRQMVLDTHAFNPPTDLGNMTFKTNAEIMARFVLGDSELPDEPHTALEDIIDYELPILRAMTNKHSIAQIREFSEAYNWRNFQVKDWFKVK